MNATLLRERLRAYVPREIKGRLQSSVLTFDEQPDAVPAYRVKTNGSACVRGGEMASVYDAEYVVWAAAGVKEGWRLYDPYLGITLVVRNLIPLDGPTRQIKLQCEKVDR